MPHNNLPVQLTSFIGREHELAEVKRLLPTTRLLTLMGVGGCGKTRLALALANEVAADYADGVWWVELAALADPAHLPQALASTLNVREQPDRPLIEMLSDFLCAKHSLLVLDNCEHLRAACAALAHSLLSTCPNTRILTTSREALHMPGEITWLVPSLSLPEAEQTLPPERLLHYEAVRLFVERTQAGLPGFTLNDQNAAEVALVCQRLDGLPLAIELAAARTKLLTVSQIAARLADTFQLLTRGSPLLLPRHQTLRATIDWSYELLSEKEQTVFRRLAAFAGGFSLEAAEAICADAAVKTGDILDLLSNLADKSLLLIAERNAESVARYRLLETIREYAAEKLQAAAEADFHARHRDWYLEFAEQAELGFRGTSQAVWFDRVELELDNLRKALRWCEEREEFEKELQLASALQRFWDMRGYLSEGREWLGRALAKCRDAPETLRAKALHAAGTLAHRQSDSASARRLLEESLAIRRTLPDRSAIAVSLNNLGVVATQQGDFARARLLLEESVAIKRELGDRGGLAYSLNNLGDVARYEGDYERAITFFEESVSLLKELENKDGVAMALQSLGSVLQVCGDSDRAAETLQESMLLANELGNKRVIALCLAGLAAIAAERNQPERAARLLGAAQAQLETIGSPLESADRAEFDRHVVATRAQLDEATFAAAWQAGCALTMEQAIAYARQGEPVALPDTDHPVAVTLKLRILALGPTQVYRGDQVLTSTDWKYAKTKELLFYLLSHASRTREQIGADLWPEASPTQLRNDLKVAVYHLRRALGQSEWIVFDDQRYSFNRSLTYQFDVESFQSQLARAQLAKNSPQTLQALQATTRLYRGEFLQDMVAGDWCLARREELRKSYLEALLSLGELLFAEARYSQAANVYSQAIACDSYLETAHRELMRCWARQGERGRALRHFHSLSQLLRDELGAAPAPETVALFDCLQRGDENY